MSSQIEGPDESSQPKRMVGFLNGTVFVAIVGFCLANGATLIEFVSFLFAWSAMTGWVKIATGVFPRFDKTYFPGLFLIVFTIFVWVSSIIAINPIVMGRLPLAGAIFLYAYSSVPELVRQFQNPESEIYYGRSRKAHRCNSDF